MIMFMLNSRNCKLLYSCRKYISGCWGWGVEGGASGSRLQKGMRKLGTRDMFVILTVGMVSAVYTCTNIHPTVYFTYVQFIVCQSYFNKAMT